MTRTTFLRFATALVLLAAAPFRAHADDPRQMCASHTRVDSIRACSRLIEDTLSPPEERIIALRNRGFSYQQEGELDRAIADYNAAIKLALSGGPRPRGQDARILAKTYVDRGVAWREKGDVDKALSDFDAALAADPTLISAQENRDALFFKRR